MHESTQHQVTCAKSVYSTRCVRDYRAVPDHRRVYMRHALAHHAHTFDWLTPHHDSPYNVTIRALQTRLTYMWGFTYRRSLTSWTCLHLVCIV